MKLSTIEEVALQTIELEAASIANLSNYINEDFKKQLKLFLSLKEGLL
jgi:hypothetical protein